MFVHKKWDIDLYYSGLGFCFYYLHKVTIIKNEYVQKIIITYTGEPF